MNTEEAKNIIQNNFDCKENSFVYFLHEKNCFSIEQFWYFYDSIATLRNVEEKTTDLTKQITHCYEYMLKCFVFHLDPNDRYEMQDFPNNYNDYLDRLDYILTAYHNSITDLLDDSVFELQRT